MADLKRVIGIIEDLIAIPKGYHWVKVNGETFSYWPPKEGEKREDILPNLIVYWQGKTRIDIGYRESKGYKNIIEVKAITSEPSLSPGEQPWPVGIVRPTEKPVPGAETPQGSRELLIAWEVCLKAAVGLASAKIQGGKDISSEAVCKVAREFFDEMKSVVGW